MTHGAGQEERKATPVELLMHGSGVFLDTFPYRVSPEVCCGTELLISGEDMAVAREAQG